MFDFCTHSVHQVNYSLNKKSSYLNVPFKKANASSYLLYGFPFATSSVTIRSDFLSCVGDFDESPSMVACEDFDLWYRCICQTNNSYFDREILGSIETGQPSESSRNMSIPLTAVLNKHRSSLSPINIKRYDAVCKFYDLKHKIINFTLLIKKISPSDIIFILIFFLPIKFIKYLKNKFQNA